MLMLADSKAGVKHIRNLKVQLLHYVLGTACRSFDSLAGN